MELTKENLYQLAACVDIVADRTKLERVVELRKLFAKIREIIIMAEKGEKTITITEDK